MDDPEALVDVVRRADALQTLRRGPLDRRELEDALGVSRATSHRLARACVDAGLAARHGDALALTPLGEFVTDAVGRFKADMGLAARLAPLLDVVPDGDARPVLDAFETATVTEADAVDPYGPVNRFLHLLGTTRTLRALDPDALAPLYVEEVLGRIGNGLHTEAIALPAVTHEVLVRGPVQCRDACAEGRLKMWLHDELPFSLAILDDHVIVGVHDGGTRKVRALVDTDAPAARKWAEGVFTRYRDEATRMDEYSMRGYNRALAQRT